MNGIREKVLWWAAQRQLRRDRPTIVAITGSIAKTSTKQAVGAVLEAGFGSQVMVGHGNLNTYLGVPLSILGFEIDFYRQKISWQWPFILISAIFRSFRHLPKYLVLEFGADKPGDMKELTEQIQPEVGIITLTGEAHLANYESLDQLAEEKGFLAEAVKPQGLVILNKHDRFLSQHQVRSKARVELIDAPTEDIAETAAMLAGRYFGLNDRMIGEALTNRKKTAGRLHQVALPSWSLIDDSYNASPPAMTAAFNVLGKADGRKVAVLGSMLELGKNEVEFHQQVGEQARKSADVVIAVGELAKHYRPDHWFADSALAAREIFPILHKGDTILVKGSRGIRMEKIVEALLQHGSH